MKRHPYLLNLIWFSVAGGWGCGSNPVSSFFEASLVIQSPKENATYFLGQEKIAAVVEAKDPSGPVQVELFLEDRSLAVLDKSPFEQTLELDRLLSDGALERWLTLRVEAKSLTGQITRQSVFFQVTRRVLWAKEMGGPLLGSPEAFGENALVTTPKGKVLAFTSMGKEESQFQADNEVVAPASVFADKAGLPTIVLGDIQGIVYNLGPDGKLLANKALGAKPGAVSAPISGDVANALGAMYAPMLDGRVYSFTLANQNPSTLTCEHLAKLRQPIVEGLAVYEDGAVALCSSLQAQPVFYDAGQKDFWAPPVQRASPSGGQKVLVGGRDGKLYEFTPSAVSQPQILAALRTGPILTRPLVTEDKSIFVATEDGVLYRLSETGNILWKILDPGAKWLEPAASDSMLYTATAAGVVRAYPLAEHNTPKPAWELNLAKPLQGHPLFLHSILYLNTAGDQGTLLALDAR